MDAQSERDHNKYLIMYSAVVIVFFVICIISWVAYELWWFQQAAVAGQPQCGRDTYWIATMEINSSLFKRSLSILGGMAIMLTGMATSYAIMRSPHATVPTRKREATVSAGSRTSNSTQGRSHDDLHNIVIEAAGAKASIATASPGLVAMLCGAAVICFVISSKDDIGAYGAASYYLDKDTNKTVCIAYKPPATVKTPEPNQGKS